MSKAEKHGRVSLCGVAVDLLPQEAVLAKAEAACRERGGTPFVIHTPNAEALTLSYRDGAYAALFSDCDLSVADGEGLLWAARLLQTPIPTGKLAGIDLLQRLLSRCGEKGYTVYLLGGKPGVALRAAERLRREAPNLRIVGTQHGYFDRQGAENRRVVEEINRSSPDLLAVCMGMPCQEQWMRENRHRLSVGVMGGFGGALDVYAGDVRRAPKLVQRLRLEWLWRAAREPIRFRKLVRYPALLFYCFRCGRRKKRIEQTRAR